MNTLAQHGRVRSRLPDDVDTAALGSAFDEFLAADDGSGRDGIVELRDAAPALRGVFAGVHGWVAEQMRQLDPELAFSKLWCVRSDEDSGDADRVPWVPHIDRDRYVKAMVYLDAVSEADGPLTIATASPAAFEARRQALGPDYKARGENVVRDATGLEAMTGPAGSVVFFDTNVPHHAARVAPGRRRRVLRFDYARPAWNQRSALARLRAFLRRRGGARATSP